MMIPDQGPEPILFITGVKPLFNIKMRNSKYLQNLKSVLKGELIFNPSGAGWL